MYYVLQVAPGTEAKTEKYMLRILPSRLYGRCFYPIRHRKKKFHGKWKDIYEKLIPGYVFITTDHVEDLYLELEKVPVFTKLLGKNDGYFSKLQDSDVEWLEKLMNQNNMTKGTANEDFHEVLISKVSVEEGGEVKIISGPLKNMEGRIKKLNLHKRIAEVEVEFMNRMTVLYLGIELLKNER